MKSINFKTCTYIVAGSTGLIAPMSAPSSHIHNTENIIKKVDNIRDRLNNLDSSIADQNGNKWMLLSWSDWNDWSDWKDH